MTARDLAMRIPAEVRSQRLLTEADPIITANATATDPKMILIVEVWYAYIEPFAERSYCPVCIANILSNMRKMREYLIELETNYQTLKQL